MQQSSGWFSGLSAKFLTVRAARLLILAGTDRLDKTLMIGQMQGKFQLEVVPDVGHMVHEVGVVELGVVEEADMVIGQPGEVGADFG